MAYKNYKIMLQSVVARLQAIVIKSCETPGFNVRHAVLNLITDILLDMRDNDKKLV